MHSVRVRAALATVILSLALPTRAAAPPAGAGPTAATLRAEDGRLAAIGYRLFTANVALCRAAQPELGWVLQAVDQFDPAQRAAARAAFGFETPVAVETVVPGGPAARAGVVANDSLVTAAGAPLPAPSGKSGVATRNAVEARFAALPPTAPIRVDLRHDGRDRSVTVTPVPGCRSGLEMVIDSGWLADSDGARIRIGDRWLERFSDGEVAAIVAHEFAHTVLEHQRRLEAAGISHGLLSTLGPNSRIFRETEDQADQLSVSLLYNAGYDPAAAARFWREQVPAIDTGLLRTRTHRPAAERADRIAAEAATIPAGAPRPYRPPVLATRDTPLR